MAITFKEQVKKQRNFIILFAVLVVVIAAVLWWGYRVEEESLQISISKRLKNIEIDFSVFQNELLKKLQLIEASPAFEGDFGRENPFIPF